MSYKCFSIEESPFIEKCVNRGLIKESSLTSRLYLTLDSNIEFVIDDDKIEIWCDHKYLKNRYGGGYFQISVEQFVNNFSNEYRDIVKLVVFYMGDFSTNQPNTFLAGNLYENLSR